MLETGHGFGNAAKLDAQSRKMSGSKVEIEKINMECFIRKMFYILNLFLI